MKPKEWLLKNGHIKEITRGRLSRENIERIENAVREGAVIEGYAVSKSTPADNKPVEVDKRPVANVKTVADVPDERRPEDTWEAFTDDHAVSMRTVCNVCGNSLSYCPCSSPLVWLDFDRQAVVNFRVRKSPLPIKRW